jgi:hypothetical protein
MATRLDLFSGVLALIGCMILVIAQNPGAYIWFAASIIWFALAVFKRRASQKTEPSGRRIVQRFARLLLFS